MTLHLFNAIEFSIEDNPRLRSVVILEIHPQVQLPSFVFDLPISFPELPEGKCMLQGLLGDLDRHFEPQCGVPWVRKFTATPNSPILPLEPIDFLQEGWR